VNELLVWRAIANGIELRDYGINTSNVFVCIIALHFNSRESLGENEAALSISRLIPGL
jgi:hypothetical protein